MSVRNLDALFRPSSVAVLGASNRPHSVGGVVLRNLLAGGFAGPVLPVNPHHQAVAGVLAYPDVASLPVAPELALLCTPPPTLAPLVAELARRGTRGAVVITGGLAGLRDGRGQSLEGALLAAAGRSGLRLLGPNCLGLLVPGSNLDASFAHVQALPGDLAFLSQSGAVCTAALDWARFSGVGFSHFVSLGNSLDVDAGDLLDHFGADPATRAILLYIESVRHPRKFLSAARAAARNKPVMVIKSGRRAEGARAAGSHSGALAGADDVYDAAIRRAGMLRVSRIDELFDAAETVARAGRIRGDRLAILTNGGGLGVMATDTLVTRGGRLAELAPETRSQLAELLPAGGSGANPVDIVGDAPGERFAAALRILIDDPGADAVLVIHAPTAIASGEEAAAAVAGVAQERRRGPHVLTSWVGRQAAEPARRILREAGIPSYDTPDDAVAAFVHLVDYRRNQDALMEIPPSLPVDFEPDVAAARQVIQEALSRGCEQLSEPEARAVLAAFGVPAVETRIARDGRGAARIASELGLPVALKILSPDIVHKSDVGGVVLDLDTTQAVREAADAMGARLRAHLPGARLEGFSLQPMARRPGAHELILGAATDPVFGPVLLFGQGGTAVEVVADRAVALPPLNLALARDLMSRTRVSRLLAGYRDRPAADLEAIAVALTRLSQLLVLLPEVVELDVNPLLADEKGVLALDWRMRVTGEPAPDRLAIRPYPRELEEELVLRGGRRLLVRPIRPEDEPAHQAFLARLEPEDVYFRFFNLVREMPHTQMARYTQIDYDREMAFIATDSQAEQAAETLGVVRTVSNPDGTEAEFAIIVRSDMKGLGLGRALLEKMIRYCRERGIGELVGQVLPTNRAMLSLAVDLGFASRSLVEDGVVEVRLPLAGAPRRPRAPRRH
jgi:acetyltransferase